jgi:glycosyltransferase involved in cell wall biosynthesis
MVKVEPRTKVAIIIPAYNEQSAIGSVIKELRAALAGQPWHTKIIVVDDGSSDGTAQQAQKAGAYVIRHLINVGVGGATATGFRYAVQHNYSVAVTIDADGQHTVDDAINGIKLLLSSDLDILIGSRLIDPSGMSSTKLFGNRVLSHVTRLLFGVDVTDSQSGLRVFSKTALHQLRWKASGYVFCSELLWRAKQAGLKIGEYPIRAVYSEYSVAKGQSNWNAVRIIRSLLVSKVMDIFDE